MNILNRRIAIGLLSGFVLLAGSTAAYTVQAARATDTQIIAAHGQKPPKLPQMDADKAAQHLTDTFGVNKEEVLSYAKTNNNDFRNAFQGAMLSKISGKSFTDVMSLKTSDNHWKDVEDSLGINQQQIRDLKQNMLAAHLAQDGNISEDAAQQFLKQGYHPRDIQAAAILAKASNKDIQVVLSKKAINNSWKDVAESLQVDAKILQQGKKHGMAPRGEFGASPAADMQSNNHPEPPVGDPADDGEPEK